MNKQTKIKRRSFWVMQAQYNYVSQLTFGICVDIFTSALLHVPSPCLNFKICLKKNIFFCFHFITFLNFQYTVCRSVFMEGKNINFGLTIILFNLKDFLLISFWQWWFKQRNDGFKSNDIEPGIFNWNNYVLHFTLRKAS